jgi:hypothetical protein
VCVRMINYPGGRQRLFISTTFFVPFSSFLFPNSTVDHGDADSKSDDSCWSKKSLYGSLFYQAYGTRSFGIPAEKPLLS